MQRKQSRSARFVAVETLCHLYRERLPVKTLFDTWVKKHRLPGRERNLAMQLVYGVLRHRQYLDRILQLLSKTPLAKIDPFIHQVLAVGLYQLFFLERIPQSAAVNEMVECCKVGKVPKRLEGFVNGILRQSVRQKEALMTQGAFHDTGEPVTNHPQWMVDRWRRHFGRETAARICAVNTLEPALVLLTNTEKITRDQLSQRLVAAAIDAHPGSYGKDAIVLPAFQGNIASIPGYAEGLFQVQNEAAQLATTLLGPFRQGGRYLDGCAGLGGKTSHLLQLGCHQHIETHAVEPAAYRLHKLNENLARLGASCRPVIHATTLQQYAQEGCPPFDGILIDAPCSGTGVTGRHPDIRWNREQGDIQRYSEEQLSILESSVRLLAPGSVLVYATCSIEPEENRKVVDIFLARHPTLRLTDCTGYLPEAARRLVIDRCFAPLPDGSLDGFFAARMQMG